MKRLLELIEAIEKLHGDTVAITLYTHGICEIYFDDLNINRGMWRIPFDNEEDLVEKIKKWTRDHFNEAI